MINLARVIRSPMMSQVITIERQAGSWEDGEFSRDGTPQVLTMRGIVTVATPGDLNQVPEGDRRTGAMRVLTTERLYATGDMANRDKYSDSLLWRGERYKIYSVTPDADYGFFRSLAMIQGLAGE